MITIGKCNYVKEEKTLQQMRRDCFDIKDRFVSGNVIGRAKMIGRNK